MDEKIDEMWREAFNAYREMVGCQLGICDSMKDDINAILEIVSADPAEAQRLENPIYRDGKEDECRKFILKKRAEAFDSACLPIKHLLIEQYNESKNTL